MNSPQVSKGNLSRVSTGKIEGFGTLKENLEILMNIQVVVDYRYG